MKKCYGLIALALLLSAPVLAQDNTIGVYFDTAGTQNTAILNGGFDELHTAYIIGFGEMVVGGAAFKLDMDPRITLINATFPAGVQIGTLVDGIEIGLQFPAAGYYHTPVLLGTMTLFTNGYLIAYGRLNIVPFFPNYENVTLADAGGFLFPAIGLCSWMTIPVATEESTWGGVKALYQ